MQKNENEEIKCDNLCVKYFIDQKLYQIFAKILSARGRQFAAMELV
jgi:hypothetical protein